MIKYTYNYRLTAISQCYELNGYMSVYHFERSHDHNNRTTSDFSPSFFILLTSHVINCGDTERFCCVHNEINDVRKDTEMAEQLRLIAGRNR